MTIVIGWKNCETITAKNEENNEIKWDKPEQTIYVKFIPLFVYMQHMKWATLTQQQQQQKRKQEQNNE